MGRTGIGVIWLFSSCVIQTSLGHLVNVARGKTCNQSTKFGTAGYPSRNAANGNTDGTFNTSNCIHTYGGEVGYFGTVDSSPWWQVNLGRNYPVFHITVWARADYVDRLYPLTITVDGQQCVRVNSSNSREQSLNCASPMSGRLVRLTRGDRKVTDRKALPLNLCEVQIWSTCQDGDYSNGTACVPCSSNCNNRQCNSDTGRCDSRPQGRYGDRCELSCAVRTSQCTQCVQDGGQCTMCHCTCRQGWYGDKCESSCSDHTSRCTQCAQDGGHCTVCSDNFAVPQCTDCVDGFYKTVTSCTECTWKCDKDAPCNKTTGHCAECPPGKKGDRCDRDCNNNHYGPSRCSLPCGQCKESVQCDPVNGHCQQCEPGWYLPLCQKSCTNNTYGINCSQRCGQCKWGQACNPQTGECTAGCKPGFKSSDVLCKTKCDNRTHGENCSLACGHCQGNDPCHHVTGKCETGCTAGFSGAQCLSACTDNTYGINCSQSCGQCKGGQACNPQTGECTAGCGPGFKSSDVLCKTKCDNRTHGETCSLACGHCQGNDPCHHVTGKCETGCMAGFSGAQCLSACTDNTYGINCSQSCGQCKGGQACNPQTGQCTPGCGPGFKSSDVLCKTKCDNRTHGENCSLACGHCQGNDPCHHVTGKCETGCMAGFSGAQCLSAVRQEPEDSFPLAVVGAVVGVLLVIAIVAVVVVIVFRRRRQPASKPSGTAGETAEMSSNMEEETGTKSNVGSHTPLSFDAVAVDGDRNRGGDIYENASATAIASSSKSADKGKGSVSEASAQPSNDKTHGAFGKKKKKPLISAKPPKSTGVVYENVPVQQTVNTDTDKPANRTAKASKTLSQPSNGKASSVAGGKKLIKPPTADKPGKGKIKPPTADKPGKGKKAAPASDENTAEPEDFEVEEHVYGNDPKFFKTPKSLVLSQLQESVADKLRGTTLEEEFEFMEPVKAYPMKQGEREENYYKNRFKTILPYDNNRIELDQVDGDDASDFVNASFIKGFKLEKGYIASQGPKQNILDDFWRMVWQEKVTDIVMLTNLKEGKKNKCSEYWPSERATLKTRHMEVTGVGDVETRAHFVIRTFDIKHKEGKEKRRLKQYHYVSWMDHEVPAITPLINFWRYVRTRAPRLPSAPPLLVHCSAGVGRTGTFVALDIAIDESEQASEVNLFNIVDRLRDDRCYMVQNKEQYAFLHKAVLEAYTSRNTRIQFAAMGTVLPTSFNRNTPNAKIDAEYEMLNKIRNCPTAPTYTMANLSENTAKNRNPKVLPNDNDLVYITRHVRGRNQYINGVSLPTFLQQRGSIMTQLPLPDTVIDLWRLVDGSDVKLIVSLGDVEGKQDMFCYWPKKLEKPLHAGPYVIQMKSSAKLSTSLCNYNLSLENTDGSTKEVRVLHYTSWSGECADNTDELIHLLTVLQDADGEKGGDPVIIQCIDGSLRSSVLCALWDVVSRMTHDEELDVYLAARMVTMARPEAFVSVEQYRYCYEVVQHIKNSQNMYSNM